MEGVTTTQTEQTSRRRNHSAGFSRLRSPFQIQGAEGEGRTEQMEAEVGGGGPKCQRLAVTKAKIQAWQRSGWRELSGSPSVLEKNHPLGGHVLWVSAGWLCRGGGSFCTPGRCARLCCASRGSSGRKTARGMFSASEGLLVQQAEDARDSQDTAEQGGDRPPSRSRHHLVASSPTASSSSKPWEGCVVGCTVCTDSSRLLLGKTT